MPSKERTLIQVLVTPEELACFDRLAKKHGLTLSDWCRAACFMEGMLSGDIESVQLLVKRGSARIRESMRIKELLAMLPEAETA